MCTYVLLKQAPFATVFVLLYYSSKCIEYLDVPARAAELLLRAAACIRQHMLAYVRTRQLTSAYVSLLQRCEFAEQRQRA